MCTATKTKDILDGANWLHLLSVLKSNFINKNKYQRSLQKNVR